MTLRVSLDDIVSGDTSGLLSAHPSWRRVRLRDVAWVQNGFPFKSASFSRERGTPLIRIRDVGNNDPETSFDGNVDPSFIVRTGDVLIGMDGEFRVAHWAGPEAALNQRVCRVVTTSKYVNEQFLVFALQPYLDAVNRATSAITVKHLSSATVQDLPLPLPPLPEQERIVSAIEEAFSKLDAGEAGLHATRQLLRRMRDSVLTAAVTGRLAPQDATDTSANDSLSALGITLLTAESFPALPEGWSWVSLGSIARSVRNGVFVSRPSEQPPGVAILRIGAVRRMALDVSDVRYAAVDALDPQVGRAFLRQGDLLFTRYNGNSKFVGACAVVPELPTPLLHPDKLIRVVLDRGAASPEFVAIAVTTGVSRRYIDSSTKTTAGQAGIAGGELKRVPVPLAPLAEQSRIVADVEWHMSFIEACERAVDSGLARSEALRRSILKAAFEGKLVPQDPADEPASVLLDLIRAERAQMAPGRVRRRNAKSGFA